MHPIIASLLAMLLTLQVVGAGEAPDAKVLRSLVDKAVALGFPACASAQLGWGDLVLEWKDEAGQAQRQTHSGLHVQLADQSWLVRCVLPLKPRDGLVIKDQGLKRVTAAKLPALVAKENPWITSYDFNKKDGMGLAFRERHSYHFRGTKADMVVLVSNFDGILHGDPRDAQAWLGGTGAVLVQQGVENAGRFPTAATMVVGSLTGSDHPANEPGPFVPQPDAVELRGWAMMRCNNCRDDRFTPAADVALRRGLHAWFRRQLGTLPAPFIPMPGAKAVAGARAFLAADDTVAAAQLALLAQRSNLPAKASPTAAIADRLVVWEAGQPLPIDKPDDFVKQLDRLITDPRLSRWLDQDRPRTVGDNALRALVELLGLDPRLALKRERSAPWTDQERTGTITALGAWWSKNRAPTIDETATRMAAAIPPEALRWAQLGSSRMPPGLALALAKGWTRGPPAEMGGNQLALLMRSGHESPAFSAIADGWPCEGLHRGLLLAWQAWRGHPEVLARALTELCEKKGDVADAGNVVAAAGFFLGAADLKPLQQVLAGAVDSPAMARLVIDVARGGDYEIRDLLDAMSKVRVPTPRVHAFPLALMLQQLADLRPAPKAMVEEWQMRCKRGGREPAIPADLRIADIAAHHALTRNWYLGVRTDHDNWDVVEKTLGFDQSKPKAVRDQALERISGRLSEAAITLLPALGLPLDIPGCRLKGEEKGVTNF